MGLTLIKMFYFIKPNTKLHYRKNHEITEYVKVEYSKESNDHFNKIMSELRKIEKRIQ